MADAPRKVPDFLAAGFATVFTVAAMAGTMPDGRKEATAPMPQKAATFTNLLDANFFPFISLFSN